MNNESTKLGGPNADVIERIEKMKRPKLVQAHGGPLTREDIERIQEYDRAHPIIDRTRSMRDFPPKHIYEPVKI